MPQPLAKTLPHLDIPRAQAQVCLAMRRALQHCKGLNEFTRRLNALLVASGERPITRQAVQWWVQEGTFVDRKMWAHFEHLTDMLVTRRHLAPHIYGIIEEPMHIERGAEA